MQFSSSAEAVSGDSARGPSKLSSVNWGRARHEAVNSSRAGPVDVGDRLPALPETGKNGRSLPRKEVIQPQLPLRLPCYDFTPITSPTFDGSLPKGLGHRLRVLPAFVV